MIERIKQLFRKGLFHIMGSTFINKCIAFITNIGLVRVLSKPEFGIFTAAFNIFSIVYLFSGFGITNGMLYFCSQKRSEESKARIYKYAIQFGLLSEIVLSIVMLLYAGFAEVGIEESRKYIYLLSLLPMTAFFFDYFSIMLRTKKKNREYSLLLNINSVLYMILAISGSYIFGIIGTLIGRYLAYIISAVIGYFFCRNYISKDVFLDRNIRIKNKEKKHLLRYSIKAGLTSALNNILYRLDVLIIGVVIADASILAAYKVGVAIPENMNFIPASMMVFVLPFFIEHANEKEWIRNNSIKLYLSMGLMSAVLCVFLIAAAPLLISILWGNNYMDAVPCFRILTVSFFFLSTFRLTSTNILLSMGKSGYTLMVSVISGISNILLDLLLTVKYGSIGAAYATLIVTILASALSFPYVLLNLRTNPK